MSAMTTPVPSDPWVDSSTSQLPGDDTAGPAQSFPISVATHYLRMIYPPIFLLFGVFGNVMTIVVMRRTTSRESAIDIYFIATAVVDLTALIPAMVEEWVWFTFGFSIITTHAVLCKAYLWLCIGGSAISCWYLVCMTVHRAMSVVWPHRVNVLCTRRTVLLVLTGITVSFALLYSHYLIGYERLFSTSTKTYSCEVRSDNEGYIYFMENMFIYVQLLFDCLLPFTFFVVSNSILVWKLGVSVKAANRMLTHGDSDKNKSREKAANSVTLTVVVVSLAFIVLTLPASINFIVNYYAMERNRVSGYELAMKDFITTICFMPRHANSAVNFYLYCLTGRRFREEFLKVLCCGRNRERRGVSQ